MYFVWGITWQLWDREPHCPKNTVLLFFAAAEHFMGFLWCMRCDVRTAPWVVEHYATCQKSVKCLFVKTQTQTQFCVISYTVRIIVLRAISSLIGVTHSSRKLWKLCEKLWQIDLYDFLSQRSHSKYIERSSIPQKKLACTVAVTKIARFNWSAVFSVRSCERLCNIYCQSCLL